MSTIEAILVLALGAAIAWGVQRFIAQRKEKSSSSDEVETEIKNKNG